MNRPCLSVIFFTFNEHMSLLVIMFFLARLILKKIYYINGGLLKQLPPTEKEKKIIKIYFLNLINIISMPLFGCVLIIH